MGAYVTLALDDNDYKELIQTIREGYIDNDNICHKPNNQVATILILEANLGCRIGDIIALKTDSIILEGGIWKLNITEQKTGKTRNFIVPKPVKAFIDKWTAENHITEGRLFSIEAPAVWKQLRAATAYLGLVNVSTHSFRKKCASDIYERTGHDIEAVCSFLQHADTKTTRRYIRRSDAQLEAAIMQAVNII